MKDRYSKKSISKHLMGADGHHLRSLVYPMLRFFRVCRAKNNLSNAFICEFELRILNIVQMEQQSVKKITILVQMFNWFYVTSTKSIISITTLTGQDLRSHSVSKVVVVTEVVLFGIHRKCVLDFESRNWYDFDIWKVSISSYHVSIYDWDDWDKYR